MQSVRPAWARRSAQGRKRSPLRSVRFPFRHSPATSRRHLSAGIVLLSVFLSWAAASAIAGPISESPTETVRATINEVIRILEDPKLKDPAKLIPRRRMLEEAIAARFDYAEMSKRALAFYWRPLTAAERTEFVDLFRSFLSDRYAEKIEGYAGEQVFYLSERIEDGYAEVRTELRSSKVDIPMDYRLYVKGGQWHAYDMIVDGVSLVKNYRSQFNKIIRERSYQGLVQKLRDRTVTEETNK